MRLKAQSSIEFLMLVGLAFSMVILFIAFSANEIEEFKDKKEFLIIKDLVLKLQKEVSIAAAVEDGYERSFNLPDKLDITIDYFIITTNTSITINSSNAVFSAAIPTVTGNFTKGSNKIEKTNNRLYINK